MLSREKKNRKKKNNDENFTTDCEQQSGNCPQKLGNTEAE